MNRQHSGGARRDRQPRRQPARISAARLVAYDVLRDVEERDAYANLALPARIRDAGLDSRDAALATELAAGALRLRGRYDRIIELAAGRDIDRIDTRTRNVLRLGAHQLLSMRTAAHAAVNESVELQRRVANANAAGFVNGVLRAIGRDDGAAWDARIAEAAKNADEAAAQRTSHPAWVLRALRAALGAEGRAAGDDDELPALLAADNVPPRVNLALLPSGQDTDAPGPEAAAAALDDLEATGVSPIGLELHGGDPSRTIADLERLGIPAGHARVQDQGSQLAALALTRARPIRAGERWLDLCAGPGGKTAVLAGEALASGTGTTVRANEVSEHRADLVRDSVAGIVARSADTVTVVAHDGRDDDAFGGENARYDRILLDAPCSGLGALRRRPEARWRKQPADLPELTQLQAELLEAAIAHLAPGGLLAYVTCSPHRAETRVVVDRALKQHADLAELDAQGAVRGAARADIDLAGDVLSAQLWPHRHGTDAMFVSLLTRQATPAP